MPGKKKLKSLRSKSLDHQDAVADPTDDDISISLSSSCGASSIQKRSRKKQQETPSTQSRRMSEDIMSSYRGRVPPAQDDAAESEDGDRRRTRDLASCSDLSWFSSSAEDGSGRSPESGPACDGQQQGSGNIPRWNESGHGMTEAGTPEPADVDDVNQSEANDNNEPGQKDAASNGENAKWSPSATKKDRKKRSSFTSEKANKSRNVKTAPSTPESENHKLPRHAESTSHLEISANYGKRSGVKGMENLENVKPPDKKVTANMSKSRNEKFHKLFKNIPEKEKVLKSCLCAYVGDILLQGYFYILPSYFCFYTKILGHEKQLEIPVSEVLNITREKTALFIPNAIGVQTKTEKYVFGSLMSRDSTYSLMCSVWKKKIPNAQVSDLKASDSDSSTGQDYIVAQDGVSSVDDEALPSSVSGSDVSDDSLCPSCGMPLVEHEQDRCRRDDVKTDAVLCNGTVIQRSAGDQTGQHESVVHRSHPAQKASKNRQKQNTTSPDGGPVGWFNSISRTSALLMTCVIIAIVLVLLAAFMSYKILLLQTQIDLANQLLNPSFSKYEHSRKLYSDLYYLNDRYHTSTIERFHHILEANIELLSQVHASLFSLHKTSNLSGEQHSCQKSDDCQENS